MDLRTARRIAGLKDKRGFIDKNGLNLSERKAVEYWMKRWGVTRDQLVAAHRKAGLMIKDIAAELGKKPLLNELFRPVRITNGRRYILGRESAYTLPRLMGPLRLRLDATCRRFRNNHGQNRSSAARRP